MIIELDVGDAWEVESDDESLSCYGEASGLDLVGVPDDIVTLQVDKRKSSTGSHVRTKQLHVWNYCTT